MLGIHTGVDNREVVRSSDVVIIAVKPHAVLDVLQDVMSVVHANHLIISVAAGFSIPHIERVITLHFACPAEHLTVTTSPPLLAGGLVECWCNS